ncbi:hypothetical protein LIA77_02511 [Sarocladium implicatum]|nr:hypothetical protein LIA77_02511 [Sarocladium implicatum]
MISRGTKDRKFEKRMHQCQAARHRISSQERGKAHLRRPHVPKQSTTEKMDVAHWPWRRYVSVPRKRRDAVTTTYILDFGLALKRPVVTATNSKATLYQDFDCSAAHAHALSRPAFEAPGICCQTADHAVDTGGLSH